MWLACLGLVGCNAGDLAWQFEIDPSIDDATRGIVATVRDDACGGAALPLAVYRFARGEEASVVTPTLPPGTYFLEVVALDAQCRPVGRGCEPVALPDEQALVVGVDALGSAEAAACESGAACAGGVCVAIDAGP